MVDEAQEWRDKLIEAVAESDEALMEKFFEDSDSITKEEMFTAISKGNNRYVDSADHVWFCI